jgi:regulator of protease activity HflC (stomatin/prohibitin superfamily)
MENNEIAMIKFGIFAVVVLVLFLILNPFVQVNRGERGVVMNWGAVSDKVLGKGYIGGFRYSKVFI